MIYRLITYCLLFFVCLSINAQERDSIFYILPDSVEVKIYKETKNIDLSKFGLHFFLSMVDNDKFQINYSYFPNSAKPNDHWVENTNRFLIVNDNKFPLVFDYDSKFSTKRNSMLGSFGEREGNIQRSLYVFEGYTLRFRRDGTIISEDHGIYKKND